MPLRIWHKLSKLLDFRRLVLIELEGIRRAQARLEEAQARLEEGIEKWTLSASGRLDNFFRISLQNEDASGALIANMKRQIDDLEASLQELKKNDLSKQTSNTNLDKG
jgi:exonuclease VII small subunit